MKIIIDFWQKCKGEWFLGLTLVLVALLAFGLGRYSILKPKKTPIKIQAMESVNKITTQNNLTGQVVASKQGSKYYLPTCSGVKRIKPENLISFSGVAEAKAAGYEPAANCPGL
jgi:hypothetical protein